MVVTAPQLKQALQQNYQNHGFEYLDRLETKISQSFGKANCQDKPSFIAAYPKRKAAYYHQKYGLQIYENPCNTHIVISPSAEKMCISDLLSSSITHPVGVYTFDHTKSHVDAFIVYDQKVWVLNTFSLAAGLIRRLTQAYGQENIFVHKQPNSVGFPQKDYISCPVFALKYIKECLKDNASMLSGAYIIKSETIETSYSLFILHPYVERYSQSNTHFDALCEQWRQLTENNSDLYKENLIKSAQDWRKTHDKSRMAYYILKEMDYSFLEPLKQGIIDHSREFLAC